MIVDGAYPNRSGTRTPSVRTIAFTIALWWIVWLNTYAISRPTLDVTTTGASPLDIVTETDSGQGGGCQSVKARSLDS